MLGAAFGLLFLLPFFSVVAVLIRRDSPGPVLYRRRVLARQDYRGGEPETFDALKLRTMRADADALLKNSPELRREYEKEFKLRDDPRITRVGATLRRLSLDEMPQLWNVLVGQMSLVGPRMISPPELAMYGDEAARLLSVRPGITGVWQLSDRGVQLLPSAAAQGRQPGYNERVAMDIWYIENLSLGLYLRILLRTVAGVGRSSKGER